MDLLTKLWNRKTDFKAGGLKLQLAMHMSAMRMPGRFVAPKTLDFRDMCLPPDDQGNTSSCAGRATAGFIEVRNWQVNHYPEQVNAMAIYDRAKVRDGDNSDGTTLESAGAAAISLGLFKGKAVSVANGVDEIKFAIHQYLTVIGGFMITDEWNRVSKDGTIPVLKDAQKIGGHAVLLVGYTGEYVYIQNSWGRDWAYYGFCRLSWSQFKEQFFTGMVLVPDALA